MLAVPYFSAACQKSDRNLSCYAIPRDYHLFFKDLFDRLIPLLEERYPNHRFAGFADHSPIAEVDAAAKAGLGVIGMNRLLITEPYSSFVFLGSLITDAKIPCEIHEVKRCEGCGLCRAACPAKDGSECLSAITQKKGTLTDGEEAALLQGRSAWGCDLCQTVCPHTKKALREKTIHSPIPYFREETVSSLTLEALSKMTDTAFSNRAYSWRGRAVIQRNLTLLEAHIHKKQGDEPC